MRLHSFIRILLLAFLTLNLDQEAELSVQGM